jgi:hypothetical protein
MTAPRLLAATLALGLCAGASARAEVDDAKRALILELIALSGPNAASQMTELMLGQLEGVYDTLLDQVLSSETDLSEKQKEALRSHLSDFESFSQEFRSRFAERIDVEQVIESVYVPLYDANFSRSELEEIVLFYRTPTGRKVVEVLPRVSQQGLQKTLHILQPRVMALVGEILAERRSELFH